MFIGNLSPLFLILFVIYYGTTYCYIQIILFVSSVLCVFYWKWILKLQYDGKTSKSIKQLDIRVADDASSAIITYFLTYAVSLPSVAVIGGLKGIIVLIILLFVIYIVTTENRISLFNPILFVFHYKMYRIETKEQFIGYLIVKIGGNDRKPNGITNAVQIDDFTYIERKPTKNN